MKGWSEERLKEVGNRVRQRRIEENLSQQKLADQIGISRTYISMIECGHATGLSLDTFEKVSERLGLYRTKGTDDSGQLPSGLAELGKKRKLPEADIAMLRGIVFRGRRPKTVGQWEVIYNFIESMSRTWEEGEVGEGE